MQITELSETKKGSDFENRLDGLKKAEPVSEDVANEANNIAKMVELREKKNAELYKTFAIIENYEQELNEAFFKLKEYSDLVKIRLSNSNSELSELESELYKKVSSPIDLDRILSTKIGSDVETYITKITNERIDIDELDLSAGDDYVESDDELGVDDELETEND
jgi:hypothetical protein